MTKHIHYQRQGCTNTDNWQKAASQMMKHMALADPPHFSWCEPRPESLIGTGIEPPIPGLSEGWPNLPNEMALEEILLFWPEGGITLRPAADAVACFGWKTSAFEGTTELQVEQNTATVYLRTPENLQKQYGLAAPKLHGPDENHPGGNRLQLIEYRHQGQRVAWTLQKTGA